MIIYCYITICFLNKIFKYICQVSVILLALFDYFMHLGFDFSGTFSLKAKRKSTLKGAKSCQKAKENGQFVMNCPFMSMLPK